MNRTRHIRRLAALLAGLVGALLASITAAPTALASQLRPDPPWWLGHRALPVHLPPELPGFFKHPPPPGHAAAFGGMPSWQIALIAAGAALLAPTVAVLWGRARTARRNPVTGAASAWHVPGSPG
jgi:hypothetical protein